jgi:hypothetical protein
MFLSQKNPSSQNENNLSFPQSSKQTIQLRKIAERNLHTKKLQKLSMERLKQSHSTEFRLFHILLQLYPFFHSTTIQASCDYIRLSHSIDFNTYGIQNACKFFNFAMPQPTVQNAQNPFYKFNLQHSQTVIITIN